VRKTRSPSRRKTLRPKLSPRSVVRPKSALKSLPDEETHGSVQPMHSWYRSMFCSGARDTSAKDVSRACRCAR
jgi:hypothetical protein